MPSVIIDASTAPAELLGRRMLGVPIVLWPLRAIAHATALDRVAVMTSDPGIIGLASAHGVYPLPPAPATRSAPGHHVDPLQPVVSLETLRKALADLEPKEQPPLAPPRATGPTPLSNYQTSTVERVRIHDDDSFHFAAALARGLPPDHPAILGIARLRIPLGADIRLVVCDVDGTLTDGGVSLGHAPEVQRTFHTHDGLGAHLLQQAGIAIAWLSATTSGESIHRRAEMLRITHADAAEGPKAPRFSAICKALNIEPKHAIYLGDDVNDLPAMRLAALSACPADARPEVRAAVDLVLEAPGGKGAFRELADILLAGLTPRNTLK
ncbi:MAG: HAD family hydrolase [Phycisphaerae bacterium]|nr:HAD family hydrolase [Phycisphaerae bacterium]